jgi:hypothetical protein
MILRYRDSGISLIGYPTITHVHIGIRLHLTTLWIGVPTLGVHASLRSSCASAIEMKDMFAGFQGCLPSHDKYTSLRVPRMAPAAVRYVVTCGWTRMTGRASAFVFVMSRVCRLSDLCARSFDSLVSIRVTSRLTYSRFPRSRVGVCVFLAF